MGNDWTDVFPEPVDVGDMLVFDSGASFAVESFHLDEDAEVQVHGTTQEHYSQPVEVVLTVDDLAERADEEGVEIR
jgi:hypothetical protein